MSRFFDRKFEKLVPYVPGEQPQDRKYIKLNTNESPFPPSAKAIAAAGEAAKNLNLYSDPEMRLLKGALARTLGVDQDEIFVCNGSDEVLSFAFMALCPEGAAFPDVTYGFYEVFAALHGVPARKIPLRSDFTIDPEEYLSLRETVFIANPNAPTGILLSPGDVERILASSPDRLVVIDEAYIDFGGESCIGLIKNYDNLLVTRTFSKSRSMAGARLGFGVSCRAIINDLETIKYSTNPYNVNSMTAAAGIGALADEEYTKSNCRYVIENRAYTEKGLKSLGFEVLPSGANFLFARLPGSDGERLYRALKEHGILVRHFTSPRIKDFLRITIGTKEQSNALLDALAAITGKKQ